MGSLSVGIDLVQISQIRASLDRFGSKFLQKVFTPDEIRDCAATPHLAVAGFAARFAAKEATIKVLQHLDDAMPFRCIEVRRVQGRGPEIVLSDHARRLADRAGITSLALSLSHEADYATAVVIAELATPLAARSRLHASKRSPTTSRRARALAYRSHGNKFGSER